MDPLFAEALQFIREVKSNYSAAAGDSRQTYGEFLQTLKQYRKRNIDSSIVISTVQTLFTNHPTLLNGFNHFAPRRQSAAAAAAQTDISCAEFLNRASLRSCADFLNRVGARFDGGGRYLKFLDYMHAYSRGEIDAAAVHDKAAGLFGKSNDDLLRELARFLPESREGEASRKRKIDQTDARPTRKRSSGGGGAAPPPPEKFLGEGLKAWKIDNDMEDELCVVDVRIARLEAAGKNAVKLYRRVYKGRVSPAGIRLDEHFTALDLVCVRSVGKKFLECFDRDMDMVFCSKRSGVCDFLPKLFEMMQALMEMMVALEREREKIVQRWNRIRQSR